MIKAVLFDMDGLIIDSEPIHSLSLEMLIKEYGKIPQYQKNGLIHSIGHTGDESYIEIMEKHTIQDDLEIFRKKRREIFVRLLLEKKLKPLPGFFKLIKLLKQKKIKTALVSNRFLEHVILIVENLGTKDFFNTIIGHDRTVKPKPHPDLYLKAAKELNVEPNKCVVLEDTETGVISGKSAKMKVIAIPSKYTHHQDFSKADKIVKSLLKIDISLLQTL